MHFFLSSPFSFFFRFLFLFFSFSVKRVGFEPATLFSRFRKVQARRLEWGEHCALSSYLVKRANVRSKWTKWLWNQLTYACFVSGFWGSTSLHVCFGLKNFRPISLMAYLNVSSG